MIHFTVYGKPEPAGSKRHVGNGRIVDTNPSAAEWKRKVAEAAGNAMNGAELLEGPLALTVVFHLTRPKGHYGKKGLRPSAPRRPAVRPDTTKLVRAVEDAMKDVVYRDDAQIVEQFCLKHYTEGSAHADVLVQQA